MRILAQHTIIKQRGVAAVEMAIMLPVILLLMLAVAELGRAFYQYDTLSNAVRNGTRYLATNARLPTGVVSISSSVATAAKNLVVYGNETATGTPLLANLAVQDITTTQVGTDNVSIQVTYDYVPIFASIPTFGFSSGNIAMNLVFQPSMVMKAM